MVDKELSAVLNLLKLQSFYAPADRSIFRPIVTTNTILQGCNSASIKASSHPELEEMGHKGYYNHRKKMEILFLSGN